MEQKQLTKAEKLAEEVLILSRNTLLVNLRFLDAALSQFEMKPVDESSMLTDGHFLLYNAKHVLSNFKHQKETVVRDYLHIVMHCVYRHMFMDPTLDRLLWDLACDIAVENVITDLGLKAAASFRESLQAKDIANFQKECKMLTAEKIYAYLKTNNIDPMTATEIRSRFYADNHEIWYMTDEEKQEQFGIGGNSQNEDEETECSPLLSSTELKAIWQQIAERMQVDIETFGKQHGDIPGGLMQNLKEVNREKYDYTSFLKKFAVMGER